MGWMLILIDTLRVYSTFLSSAWKMNITNDRYIYIQQIGVANKSVHHHASYLPHPPQAVSIFSLMNNDLVLACLSCPIINCLQIETRVCIQCSNSKLRPILSCLIIGIFSAQLKMNNWMVGISLHLNHQFQERLSLDSRMKDYGSQTNLFWNSEVAPRCTYLSIQW